MENLRAISNKYLEKTLENPLTAGTSFTIIDPQENRFNVIGTVGDISLLVDPITGEAMQGRTIVVTCLIKRLPKPPRRGWKVELPNLNTARLKKLYVQEVQPDRTIGLYYLSLSATVKKGEAA
ncbi:MAG: hypothetical protein FWC97_00340 [Treponema sp.]|nr:hypothetical protein [Treponema sp.]